METSISPKNDINNTEIITDVTATTKQYVHERYHKKMNIMIIIAVVISLIAIYLAIAVDPHLIALVFLSTLIPIFYYINLTKKIHAVFMMQFAQANQFNYSSTGLPNNADGLIFQIGRDRQGKNLVQGSYKNFPLALCDYQYTINAGKSNPLHLYTVFQLDLKTTLPPVLLQPNSFIFERFGPIWNMSDTFKPADRILVPLEQNLQFAFKLWTKEGFQMEALQIFPVDFLSHLQEQWKNLAIELIGQHIYIYASGTVGNKMVLDNIYGLAEYLLDYFQPKLKIMSTDVQAVESYQKKI